MNELRYNIGAGNTEIRGWQNMDLHDDVSLSATPTRSVSDIYSSHFLEYFDYSGSRTILESWHRALKHGGTLYLAVPDFEAISKIYQEKHIILMGPLFGKMHEEPIYHKATYDYAIMRHILYDIGFRAIERVDLFWVQEYGETEEQTEFYGMKWMEDCSKAMVDNIKISLNIKCQKF